MLVLQETLCLLVLLMLFPRALTGPDHLPLPSALCRHLYTAKRELSRHCLPVSSRAGAWRTFTGNEIGVLLAHWMWCCWRRDHMDDDPGCVVMLASAVSSKMLQAMAQVCLPLHLHLFHVLQHS